jgi:hypothetical protein
MMNKDNVLNVLEQSVEKEERFLWRHISYRGGPFRRSQRTIGAPGGVMPHLG